MAEARRDTHGRWGRGRARAALALVCGMVLALCGGSVLGPTRAHADSLDDAMADIDATDTAKPSAGPAAAKTADAASLDLMRRCKVMTSRERRAAHCRRRARAAGDAPAGGPGPGAGKPGGGKSGPAIEPGGTLPALDNTVPLLKPGTFRLDMSAFYATYPIFGLGNTHGPSSSLIEALTLGYGVTDRFTVFGGALEANTSHGPDNQLAPEFVDPRVGFVYRLAKAPQLWGTSVDFVGDIAANAPLQSSTHPSTTSPYGDLGPIVRGRLVATHEFGHGFTLQVNGGFQTAVVTTYPYLGLPSRTVEVDALLGLAGQYRLSMISNRLYVNGELDLSKPLTTDQLVVASPFRTADVYSATLGASYVVKPGFLIARVTDTVALNEVNGSNLFPPPGGGPRHFVSNTVGLTLSFVNWTPAKLLESALK